MTNLQWQGQSGYFYLARRRTAGRTCFTVWTTVDLRS